MIFHEFFQQICFFNYIHTQLLLVSWNQLKQENKIIRHSGIVKAECLIFVHEINNELI